MGASLSVSISQNSQSIANNTSNVTVRVTISWGSGSFNNNKKYGNLTIDGVGYDFSANFNWNGAASSGSAQLYEKTVNVQHNSDGTKKLNVYAYYETGISSGNIEASASKTLTTIPRQASLTSAVNFNDEDNPTITYSNPAGSGATALEACITSSDEKTTYVAYRGIGKTSSSYTFNLTEAERNKLRNAIPNSTSMGVKFCLKCTLGSNVYNDTISKTFSIVNANPTINPTVEDANAATIALTGDKTKLIRYYSNAAISIGAAAIKGAALKSQKATNGSKSISTAAGTIEAVESGRFDFTVSDSRGNTTRKTIDYPVIDYVKLTCNIGKNTPDAQGNFVFTLSGNYFNGSFGTVSNTLSVEYRYKTGNGE